MQVKTLVSGEKSSFVACSLYFSHIKPKYSAKKTIPDILPRMTQGLDKNSIVMTMLLSTRLTNFIECLASNLHVQERNLLALLQNCHFIKCTIALLLCYLSSKVRLFQVLATNDKGTPQDIKVRHVCSAQFLNHLPGSTFINKLS